MAAHSFTPLQNVGRIPRFEGLGREALESPSGDVAEDRQAAQSSRLYGQPRSGSTWGTKAVSSCSRRFRGLGVGPSAQALSAQPEAPVAADRCS